MNSLKVTVELTHDLDPYAREAVMFMQHISVDRDVSVDDIREALDKFRAALTRVPA